MAKISRPEGEFLYNDTPYQDVTKLTDSQLQKYINDLIFSAYDHERDRGRTAATYLLFLVNATAEKNARSSSRVARSAFATAVFSAGIGFSALIFTIFT